MVVIRRMLKYSVGLTDIIEFHVLHSRCRQSGDALCSCQFLIQNFHAKPFDKILAVTREWWLLIVAPTDTKIHRQFSSSFGYLKKIIQ